MKKTLFDVLKWQWTRVKTPWPEHVRNEHHPQVRERVEGREFSTTFIGHVTHLLQIAGINFLTDPVFSKRASPFRNWGPARHRDPALALADLPPIDVILLSHNHYDHLDIDSLVELKRKFDPLIITPLANLPILEPHGVTHVKELDWWQSTRFKDAEVTVVQAQHWSSRTLRDHYRALWGGFVVRLPGFQFYFAGDTGYASFFKEIYRRFGAMDLSLLPIGAYEPRWFMKLQHMNPDDAVMAHIDLQSKRSLGNHYGTFQLTDEGIDEPVNALADALKQRNASNFTPAEFGQTLTWRY